MLSYSVGDLARTSDVRTKSYAEALLNAIGTSMGIHPQNNRTTINRRARLRALNKLMVKSQGDWEWPL